MSAPISERGAKSRTSRKDQAAMPLYKNGAFVNDLWRSIDEGEDIPPSGHVILPLDWWRAERVAFEGSNVAIGVRVEPGARIEELVEDLPRLSLVALSFPKFQDGRNFSVARLLRERYGFRGELRAVGEILLDQMQALARCGFDAFEITDPATLQALREGHKFGLSHFYQAPAAAGSTRPWTRPISQD
jgi:uncharacterized protein (DUF934 family)